MAASLTPDSLFQDCRCRSWKLASLMVIKSISSSENKNWKTHYMKLNCKQWIICSTCEELVWQLQGLELCKTFHQYTNCFLKAGMQGAHPNALFILTYGSVSWVSGINERRTAEEIRSGHERVEDQVSGALGYDHDVWLLLNLKRDTPLPFIIPRFWINGISNPEFWTIMK